MKQWTKAHQIEAARWLLRAAEGAAMAGDVAQAEWIALGLVHAVQRRERVAFIVKNIGLSDKETARAMRRIDDFAEGRRVRETVWRVCGTVYKRREQAAQDAKRDGFPLVTVRRTRRVK